MYRYAAGSGRITVRDLWRGSLSVDLTRLASATAPERPEKLVQRLAGRRHFLVLQDDQGQNVKLNFYGTQRGARRQLAAIEPYVMADGVSRTGAVRAALDGQLWWPRPAGPGSS